MYSRLCNHSTGQNGFRVMGPLADYLVTYQAKVDPICPCKEIEDEMFRKKQLCSRSMMEC